MNPRAREIEFLALTMFAALPLYATQAISPLVVGVFHLLMATILIRVARGGGPEIVPPMVLSVFAIAYFIFFFSRSRRSVSGMAASGCSSPSSSSSPASLPPLTSRFFSSCWPSPSWPSAR